MVDEIIGAKTPRAVGRRLRFLRWAIEMGTTQGTADKIGVERTRWQNWESGVALPPAIHMMALHEIYPVLCLNYLYLGDTRNCPAWLANRLNWLERTELRLTQWSIITWPDGCEKP